MSKNGKGKSKNSKKFFKQISYMGSAAADSDLMRLKQINRDRKEKSKSKNEGKQKQKSNKNDKKNRQLEIKKPKKKKPSPGIKVTSATPQTPTSQPGELPAFKGIEKVARVLQEDPEKTYELVELIGKGGYGDVYLARLIGFDRLIAVKRIRVASQKLFDSVAKEVGIFKSLKHSYVLRYYDSFFWKNKCWLILEYMDGGSLKDVMKVLGRGFKEVEISVITRKLLKMMHFIHKSKVIHRDIKAANVLVNKKGKIKICDFGVSKMVVNTLSQRKSIVGSTYWMAPEVIMCDGKKLYDKRVDIWSLGMTLLELADGKSPYYGQNVWRVLSRIPVDPPPRLKDDPDNPKWSDEFKDFISKCLQKDPDDRYSVRKLLRHPFVGNHSKESSSFITDYVKEVHAIYDKYDGRIGYNNHLRQKSCEDASRQMKDLKMEEMSTDDEDDDMFQNDDLWEESSEEEEEEGEDDSDSSSGSSSDYEDYENTRK